ncbi:hypothetical protein ABZP36_021133 [Zizania latifolia]
MMGPHNACLSQIRAAAGASPRRRTHLLPARTPRALSPASPEPWRVSAGAIGGRIGSSSTPPVSPLFRGGLGAFLAARLRGLASGSAAPDMPASPSQSHAENSSYFARLTHEFPAEFAFLFVSQWVG